MLRAKQNFQLFIFIIISTSILISSTPRAVAQTFSDTTPPTAAITSPTGGTVSGTIPINADVCDNVGVTRVEFFRDGVILGTDTVFPYSFNWNTRCSTNGTHVLTVKGYDAAGNSVTSTPVTVTVSNSVTIPALSINDVSVTEGNSGSQIIFFTVSLSFEQCSTVTANYATANGTASAPSDYTTTSGVVSLPVGTPSVTVPVVVLGDTTIENTENFFVNLSSPQNATIADGQGIGTIQNNDFPTISIGDRTVTEGNSGTVQASFTVTLSSAAPFTVSVQYATANGTAVAPSDYASTSGTLNITTGTTGTINVNVQGDTNCEQNETYFVNLSNPTNGTITDGQGVGTITDDDSALYFDDFEDGNASDWTFTGGTWNVASGRLVGTTASAKRGMAPYAGCLNCKIETRLQTTGGTNTTTSLVGWFVDGNNNVELIMRDDTNRWEFKQRAGGVVVANQIFNQAISPNVVYKAAMSYDGVNFKVYVNDVLVMTVPKGANPATAPVGFEVNSTTGKFDEIIVCGVIADTTPPTTSITSPTNGAVVSNTITVSANASDNVGVNRVEFYLDGTTLLGTDTSSPYSIQWITNSTPNGNHNLTSKAFDLSENSTTSTPILITVNNTTTYLFFDTFDDGSASDWTLGNGWSVSSATLIGNGNNTDALAPFAGCIVCTIEADMETTIGGITTISLLGWYQSTASFVELILKDDVDKWQLRQKFGGTLVATQSANYTLSTNTNYRAKIVYNGTNFQLFINSVLIMTMPAGATPASGTAGFNVNSTTGKFKEILIY